MRKNHHPFKWLTLIYLILFSNATFGQEKRTPTLDDLFKDRTFQVNSVYGINWMRDGQYYTSLVPDQNSNSFNIIKFDITTGNPVETLVEGSKLIPEGQTEPIRFTDYSLSADENKVLLVTDEEAIYRRSSKANFYVYDMQEESLKALNEGGKVSYATLSPDGSKVAYVRDNNLYYKELDDMEEVAVTTDGEFNKIIYGSADWVYEEEFSFAKAFFWSPDSEKLAFYKFDESEVKEYNMQQWGELYPQDYKFKYPKAGEKNSVVEVMVYDIPDEEMVTMDIGEETDIYIPRIYWTNDDDLLSIIRMNRLQNKLEILHANIDTGETEVVLTEESDTYVDINYNDNLTYLEDNDGFIRTSEQDGYKHVYLYEMDGDLVRQITNGNYDVEELIGYDEDRELVYYISTEDSPLERHLYRINVKGKKKERLSEKDGVNDINMNPDFTYYIQYHSSATEPLTVTLHKAPSGELVKVLEDNSELRETLENVNLNTKEFFTIPVADSIRLNAYMIKPADFDPTKEYPVLMYVYGGPGSQTVLNNFSGAREFWHSYLADQGYLVVSVDNRGTGARGKEFKHLTYGQLGKYEVADQIAAAKYLASQPYVDEDRIGIWGWSYGGYMTSLAMFLGSDIFDTGIAVAPVTNWRFYDTIYTERYLKTPQENASGYDDYSPITHADKLEGAYLLIHGTGDDNVHFQNAVELQDALIAEGKQFESFYYPNRNHGIYGGNTRLHLFTMMTDFILENL
ncbi:S9 family peptidase [Nafulsella turpanensis]|uniref:S9 family peptidase n=1 Tax=Nafulsella turpanensis TaxID=1265690 RepID=UPI00034CCBC1|nr:S9 family peptidase [Nafulsella turpanensis]